MYNRAEENTVQLDSCTFETWWRTWKYRKNESFYKSTKKTKHVFIENLIQMRSAHARQEVHQEDEKNSWGKKIADFFFGVFMFRNPKFQKASGCVCKSRAPFTDNVWVQSVSDTEQVPPRVMFWAHLQVFALLKRNFLEMDALGSFLSIDNTLGKS